MSEALILYTNPMSRGRMARWALEEIGQPYETILLAYGPPMKSPEFLAVNPMGKVPVLTHGEEVVTETGAIIAYLADSFPQAKLAPPPGDPLRGRYLRWMFFAAGPLEESTSAKGFGWELPRDMGRRSGYGSMDAVLTAIEAAIAPGPFILGEQFSAVDIYMGSKIAWSMRGGMLEKRPSFEAYLGRILSRPAAIRANEIDNALAKAPGA